MKHRLTVIVTVYNIAVHLPRFFECMRRQTFGDYCLLVLDDGSTDDSLGVCRSFAESDDRIRVVALEHNGISKTRDIALTYVDTPLTAYADGDDYFEDDYLKHMVDAIEKYGADLVIAGVRYHAEADLRQTDCHTVWGERLIKREEFDSVLPALLWERHLNYLYSKMFRSELLKPLRVGENVMQGSDTMFVIQYVSKADSIVMIADADYHYVRYRKRSVTSYRGDRAFDRFLAIHLFLLNYCRDNDMLTDELLHIIDGRLLFITSCVLQEIKTADISDEEKISRFSHVLGNEEYVKAYNRQKKRLDYGTFKAVKPQSGKSYLKRLKFAQFRARVLERTPSSIVKLYHTVKKPETD